MRFLTDLVLINLSAALAFLLRQKFGDFIIKQAPALYWPKYVQVLLTLNLLYPAIFWLLGLYDKRQKRALLEEYLLIFGIFSTSVAILIVFLFLGRLWWMSRIVLFLFYGFSVLLLCASRLIGKRGGHSAVNKTDLEGLKREMITRQNGIKPAINEKLSIVIVTYNSLGKIDACLASLTG